MAIIIPSKNIYGDIDNPKILSNLIDEVSVDMKSISPLNEFEVPIFNGGEIKSFSDKGQSKSEDDEGYYETTAGAKYHVSYASSYLSIKYAEMKDILIPVVSNNRRIDKVNVGLRPDNSNQIQYRIIGNIEKGTATAYIDTTVVNSFSNFFETKTFEESNISYSLPEFKAEGTGSYGFSDAKATVEFSDIGNVKTATATKVTIGGVEYYKLSLLIPFGLRKIEMGGGYLSRDRHYVNSISGTYELYDPVSVEVTIYGNTIGLQIEDKTVTYGAGQNPFSISGNELLQKTEIAQALSEKIRNSYRNGKEIATLVCSISDYKDENGNVVISTTNPNLPMIINIGDAVIPMIRGIDGTDRPMSIGKTFEVLDVKHYYDGAVWQKIIIKEIK
jgi:hypothetical protein